MLDYIAVQLAPRAADEIWNGIENVSSLPYSLSHMGVDLDPIHNINGLFHPQDVCKACHNLNLFGIWQMSTIWADTVDQARDAARKYVYAGLSDKENLYGLHDCVYNYDSVKVLHSMSVVPV